MNVTFPRGLLSKVAFQWLAREIASDATTDSVSGVDWHSRFFRDGRIFDRKDVERRQRPGSWPGFQRVEPDTRKTGGVSIGESNWKNRRADGIGFFAGGYRFVLVDARPVFTDHYCHRPDSTGARSGSSKVLGCHAFRSVRGGGEQFHEIKLHRFLADIVDRKVRP